ncbi:hypothetical protein J3R82DRAFT_10501 [Butyriboletus roseoflavus]|nr:hypothetical protein J3R82DRAFT_10501 [Butyriboletus roseoflavus]
MLALPPLNVSHSLVIPVSLSGTPSKTELFRPLSLISRMPDTGCMETPGRLLDRLDKFDIFPQHEVQTDVVDSMCPPHAAEYVSAQHALAQDCATLQLIDEDIEECRMRIARANAQMHLLARQRDAVQRRLFIHRARLSPMRAVPDQVLQEIFQHCLPDDPYAVPDTHSAPLVLTHVCRRWRAVVQSTSELWSSIALHDRGVWNYELEVQMVKRWLDRSRLRPIRMSITCPPHTDFGPDRNASYSDVFQLAIAHSAQLRDLCLNVNRTYLHHLMDRASLPALQSIIISLHSIHRVDESLESNTPAFLSAPNLRCITLKGDGTSINLLPRTIFSQITHLSFDCNVALDLAVLFQDFPGLQHLTLSFSHDALRFRLPPQSDHRVVVPSLLYLDVCLDRDILDFGDPEKLETVLDQLELPALQGLSIAAPLKPRYYEQSGSTKASWENHMAWVRNSSVSSLLSRSRYARPRFECRDVVCPQRTDAWVRDI